MARCCCNWDFSLAPKRNESISLVWNSPVSFHLSHLSVGEAALSPRSAPPPVHTPGLSRLSVLPSRRFSALDSTWEGSEKGSECRLESSLPAQGSALLTATPGALGMGLAGHRSPWRLEGSGGGLSLSLLGQSPGVQGRGRRCGRLSVPRACGRSGGGGGGRSRSVGGIGRGLSLCRAPGAACGEEE